MSPNDEYTKAFEKAVSDLADRVQKRDLLNAEIAGLRKTVRVLSGRITLPQEAVERVAQLLAAVDYATPTLTSAINFLLARVHPRELTVSEIRNAIEDGGFDFDDFSNSTSACHAAVKRLLKDGKIGMGIARDGKATFRGLINLSLSELKAINDLAGLGLDAPRRMTPPPEPAPLENIPVADKIPLSSYYRPTPTLDTTKKTEEPPKRRFRRI